MPWILIAFAIGIATYGAVIRASVSVSSQTTEFAPVDSDSRATAPSSTPKLVSDKRTQVKSAPSDALLSALFGAAGVLALAGAFYARVTRLTFPGGAIDLAALSNDLNKVQQTVPDRVALQIDQLPDWQKQSLKPVQIARITSVAATQAQQELLQTRAAVKGAPLSAPVAVPPADVARAQAGMPLSDELISRLVDKAVSDAVRTLPRSES